MNIDEMMAELGYEYDEETETYFKPNYSVSLEDAREWFEKYQNQTEEN